MTSSEFFTVAISLILVPGFRVCCWVCLVKNHRAQGIIVGVYVLELIYGYMTMAPIEY